MEIIEWDQVEDWQTAR